MITTNFALIEVAPVSTTATKHPLPVDPQIEGVGRIRAITAYKVGEIPTTPVQQKAVVSDTVFKESFLAIVTANSEEVISKIPLADLNRAANNGEYLELQLSDKINLTKCYIQVSQTSDLNADERWLLGFHFSK